MLAKDSGNAAFWALAASASVSASSSAEAQYASVLVEAKNHVSGLSLDLFVAGLAARTASPAVEMQLKLAQDRAQLSGATGCTAFAEVGGGHTCDPAKLKALLSSPPAETEELSQVQLDADHVYPTAAAAAAAAADAGDTLSRPTAYLYAAIGTPEFAAFHAVLSAEAEGGNVVYVLRHHAEASSTPLRLSGYSVELDVKKLAYVAVDDKKIDDTGSDAAGAAAEEDEEEDADEDVEGFLINKLKTMHPDLSDNLKKFKEHLATHGAVIKELKVWEMQDVSVQATQRILRDDAPLKKLQDLSHFYPVRAHGLLKETVDEAVLEEITHNQESVLAAVGLEAGASLLTVNSMVLETSTADVFSLLAVLKSESRTMDNLAAVGLPATLVKTFGAMSVDKETAAQSALDVRDPAVIYYNNLEDRSDPRYSQWSAITLCRRLHSDVLGDTGGMLSRTPLIAPAPPRMVFLLRC